MIESEKSKTMAYRGCPLVAWLGISLGLLWSFTGSAQGWQKSYGGDKTDEAFAIVETQDEGYLTVGLAEGGADNDPDVLVVRTDVDGTEVWRRLFDLGFRESGAAVFQASNGDFLIGGTIEPSNGEDPDVLLLRITERGDLLWHRILDRPLNQRINDMVLGAEGDIILVGEEFDPETEESDILLARFTPAGDPVWVRATGTDRNDAANAVASVGVDYVLTGISKNAEGPDNDLIIIRFDPQGEIVWENRLITSELEEGRDVITTRDGNVVVAGLINNQQDALLAKFDAQNGDTLWTSVLGDPMLEDGLNALVELENSDLAATGFQVQADGIDVGILLLRTNADGDLLFTNRLGDEQYLDEGRDLIEAANGDLVVAGYNGFELTFFNDLILVKTDAQGNAFSNILTGRIYWDEDQQCDADANEPGLSQWLVRAIGAEQTYFGSTDRNGFFEILVDTGQYTLEAIPINRYWSSCAPDGVSLNLGEFYDTTRIDIGFQARTACPFLEVDVSVPYLARCSEVRYTVQYTNNGTAVAEGAEVELRLDPELTFTSASIAPSLSEGNVFTFPLGNVPPGSSGAFEVVAASACEGVAVNQAIKVEARIRPDTLCLTFDPGWDRSDLEVEGRCEGDSIAFSIINIGIEDMVTRRTAIVIQDDIIITSEPIELESNEEQTIKVPANGSTYRVLAEESENHPFSTYATTAIEGCGSSGTDFVTGKVTQFPEDDRQPTRSINVQEALDTPPQVQLRAHPKGYAGGLIDSREKITYQVVFTNLSMSDTVNRVVIRDTLPAPLDLSDVVFGAASHPYQAEIYEEGILKITFDDLNWLPAGSQEASATVQEGFITYEVAQRPDNEDGTLIENKVRVIFDYQAPILSNVVTHVVGTFPDFVQITQVEQPNIPGLEVNIYPNPFVRQVTFEVTGTAVRELSLQLFDANGRLIRQRTAPTNRLELSRQGLPAGSYFFRLSSGKQWLGSGQLIVR